MTDNVITLTDEERDFLLSLRKNDVSVSLFTKPIASLTGPITAAELLTRIHDGKGVLCNAHIGFGVRVVEKDEKMSIIVEDVPELNVDWDDKQLFVEETAKNWLKAARDNQSAMDDISFPDRDKDPTLEACKVLREQLPSLDAAAIPTKSETYVVCGRNARTVYEAIVTVCDVLDPGSV